MVLKTIRTIQLVQLLAFRHWFCWLSSGACSQQPKIIKSINLIDLTGDGSKRSKPPEFRMHDLIQKNVLNNI